MQTGIVKKWENNSGWGFIEGNDGEDYFLNVSNVRKGQTISSNIRVRFDIFQGQKGPEAENVSLI